MSLRTCARRCSSPSMPSEAPALFLDSDSTIAFSFLLGLDIHAESMERRCREVRRILKAAPVDRRSQRTRSAVQRRNLAAPSLRGLEPQNLRQPFHCRHPELSPRLPDRLAPALPA